MLCAHDASMMLTLGVSTIPVIPRSDLSLPPSGIRCHRDDPYCRFFYMLFLSFLRQEGRNPGETKQQCSSLCEGPVTGVKSTTGFNPGAGFMSSTNGCPFRGAQRRWVPGCRWAPISSTAGPSYRLLCSGCQSMSARIAECCNLRPSFLVATFSSFNTWACGGEIFFFPPFSLIWIFPWKPKGLRSPERASLFVQLSLGSATLKYRRLKD